MTAILSKLGRLTAIFDKSAWLLIVPMAIGLFFVDSAMLKTMLQWSGFAVVLSGVAIIVSRLVFPQLHLTDLAERAKGGSLPSAIIVAALILFVAVLFLSLVLWAKA